MIDKRLAGAAAGLVIAVATLATTASAQLARQLYDPPVGGRWTIRSEMHSENTVDGKPTKTLGLVRTAEFVVREKTPSGFRITYTMREIEAQGAANESLLANAAFRALKNVPIQAVTDASGNPVRVENLADVQTAFRNLEENLLAAFASRPDFAAKLRPVLDGMMPHDAEGAAKTCLEDLPLLAVAQNTGLSLGEVRNGADVYPALLGGASVKTNTTLRLVEDDAATREQKLIRTDTFDPVALKAFVVAMFTKLGIGGDAEQAAARFAMAHEERTEYTVEHGMTRRLSSDGTSSATGLGHSGNKHEQTVIRVTPLQ